MQQPTAAAMVVILFVGLAVALSTCQLEALHNGWLEGGRKDEQRLQGREQVGLLVDGGWYPFQFGGVNSTAKDSFVFRTTGPAILKVTDNFCAGDAFYVFDGGKYIGRTSHVPSNSCRTNTTNPDVAWNDPSFSHGTFTLEPGLHKIQFTVAESPFMAGGASLRVDSSLMGCPTHSPSGFHIIKSGVPFSAAEKACRSFGMELADVDIYNFLEVTDLAFHCSGAFSQSWIKSYWGDTYGGSCLVLSTGNMSPGGAVNVPVDCNAAYPVVCREKDYVLKSSPSLPAAAAQHGPVMDQEQYWQEAYQQKKAEVQEQAHPIPTAK